MFKAIKASVETSPLRHPAFLRLWLGLTISYLGDQFTTIALLWFVLQLTGSGTAIGLVILCFQLPGIVTGPLLGTLLDRLQPRFVMGIDNIARALLIGTIPTLYLLHHLQLWHIYVLALLAGSLSPATGAGARVILPQFVREQELERANALSSSSIQFSTLIGPMLAGIMVANTGGPWALFVDAVSFLLMGLLVLSLPSVPRLSPTVPEIATKNWLGFGVLFQTKEVLILTLLSLVFFFSYGPLEAALPIYSDKILHAGASGYGLLWSGFGVGALLGILPTSFIAARFRPGLTQPFIAILWGLFLCPLLITQNLPAACLFLALGAFAWAPYTPIETSILQRLIPAHLRGQVFGARLAIITASAPLGSVVGGFLLGYFPSPIIIGISGLACILAGIAGLLSPTLRNLRRNGATDMKETATSTSFTISDT
ncbi:MFS transporter [Ktedonosporobacter rubrisoli]|uniref:MFS transporter n=1 Tax=Ktedonosporobacter rubrisoli TaxID=2509675 RepID=UPI0013EE78E2|nr:MFS transporter [Ktedonosporobacter rubrisoli]